MDLVRRYLTQIRAQLQRLTMSQRLLIGLLVVVMIATIFFTVTLSAKPEMVVLIAQPMSAEEINRVEMYLKGKYDYQVSGDKIMVPAEKAYAIRGELFAAQALPKDTTVAMAELAKANNPFMTDANAARQWNFALQETLTRMLRYYPYIQDGQVLISKGERGTIGQAAQPSSASVTVKVKNGDPLSESQVVAIVDMIRGAVSGLRREDVHISDGMRSYMAPASDAPIPSDLLEFKQKIEETFTRKLFNLFGDVGNVKIAVNAVPDLTRRTKTIEAYDPKTSISKPVRETSHDTSTNEGSGGAGNEPGVKYNVSQSITDNSGASGRHSASTEATANTENVVGLGKTGEQIDTAPGTQLQDLTASISFPRSYFVAIYKRQNPDSKGDPDDTMIGDTIKSATTRIKSLAMNAIGAKQPEQVQVDWFDDMITLRATDVAVAGVGGSGSIPQLVTQYAKQGILAIVAIGALGMMLMMVRRAVPTGAGAEVDSGVFFGMGGGKGKRSKADPEAMDVGEDVFGEANQGDAVLTGIELDDETLQSRKMVDEVSIMIKENPENAAALVKKWMTKSK